MRKMEKVPILYDILTEKVPILHAVLIEKVPITCSNRLKYLLLRLNKRNIICCGKDYTMYSALDKFLNTTDYHIVRAVVLSNEREVRKKGGIIYQPIYYCMFYGRDKSLDDTAYIIPEITL